MPRLRPVSVIASVGVAGMLIGGCTSQASPVEPTTPPEPRLILVQVLDRAEYAVGNALMDGSVIDGVAVPASSIAYVPASLLVPVPSDATSPRRMTLGATPSDPDTLTPKTSTEAAFDLVLDGSWTLDLLAFAGLVDAVGGVIVEVPRAVRVTSAESELDVVIPAGRQRLGGIAAAEYVTAALPADYPVDQLQRFREIWVAVLARLPDSPERLRQILTSLGFLARTTASIETLLEVLESGRASVLARTVDEQFVAVDVIRGGARPAAILTPEGSRTVATMFAPFAAPAVDDQESPSRDSM